jgi:Flp pilus assembly protein CpaB
MTAASSERNEVDVSSRRTLILVGAIAIAAIAALMIFKYVGSVEDKASADNQLVPVVVATGDIKAGETADALVESKRIALGNRRRVDLPTNVVTRIEDIKGESAAIDLSAGEIITTSNFSGTGASASSSSNVLSPGDVAVTISADAGHSVGGLVQPGDFVNLTADIKNPVDGSTRTEYLYQKVKVLAIGTDVGSAAAASASTPGAPDAATPTTLPNSDLVTLEVPPEAAPIILAATSNDIRLSLVRPDYQPSEMPVSAYSSSAVQSYPGQLGYTPDAGSPSGSETDSGGTK